MTENENWYRVTRWLDEGEDCKFAKSQLEKDGIKTKIDLGRTGKVALFRCPPPTLVKSEKEQKEISLKRLQNL